VNSSVLVISVRAGRKKVGLVRLSRNRQDQFPAAAKTTYRQIADCLGFAFEHVQKKSELRERIKELTCLYGIARIAAKSDVWLGEILYRVAQILPSAWLYPDIAGARILHDGHAYTSPTFRNGEFVQRASIVVRNRIRGAVEISYSEERPHRDEGPFLKEERRLLETVAEELAAVISRREADRERLRLEDQLRHTDRLATLGQLAAGVAHEMNEPLSSVVGFAQLAKKCPGLPEQAGRDIDKVLSASLHAREVVKRLLAFTRQTPPLCMEVDLNRMVVDGLNFFENRLAKEGIKLVCSLSSANPKVKGDSVQLTQVFINLTANAVQAMPGGGTLKVRTTRQGDYASLMIEDTGNGMEREVLKNVLTPFFTTKDMGEGTGLGLPVACGIVTAHGGTLRITSKPGRGTKCIVRLRSGEAQEERGNRRDG
jgi:signal transduction histidine kinase